MTCADILNMSSTEWVAKFTATKGTDALSTIRAIDVYGKCYDARTDDLAESLTKSGKSPSANERANFNNVEQALRNFTAKALIDSQPAADAVKSTYAMLYEKQFRYEFYEGYQPPPSTTAAAAPKDASAASQGTEKSAVQAEEADASDSDPVTDAKNHFGGLLNDLPDDKLHELHLAFGEILGPNSAAPRTQVLIYRYAIFLLEPPGGQPFSPPPF